MKSERGTCEINPLHSESLCDVVTVTRHVALSLHTYDWPQCVPEGSGVRGFIGIGPDTGQRLCEALLPPGGEFQSSQLNTFNEEVSISPK